MTPNDPLTAVQVNECADEAAPPLGCGDDAGCIYCNAAGIPYTAGCELTSESTGGSATRCSGTGEAHASYMVDIQPYFEVKYPEGVVDAEGGDNSFIARAMGAWDPPGEYARYKYMLNRNTLLLVNPCAPTNYCDFGYWAIWLCRIFFQGLRSGWRMWCNSTEEGGAGDNQLAYKPILLDLDIEYGLAFVHLVAGHGAPPCFATLADVQCFSRWCDGEKWSCAGDLSTQVDRLFIDLVDLHYSMDPAAFAQRNPYDIELKNAVWATLAPLVDQLDSHPEGGAAHDNTGDYNDPGKAEWEHAEDFADAYGQYPIVEGHLPSGLDEGDFPGAYADLAGEPIPLAARSFLTGVGLPAVLTVMRVYICLHLHVENIVSFRPLADVGWRVFADIIIRVLVRVKLLPEAYSPAGYPFRLIGRPDGGRDDPYDLRVEDPNNPGQVHPVECLTVVGPNGERVPTQVYAGDVSDPMITIPHLSWRGLKTTRRFSRGPITGAEIDETGVCCQAYGAINGEEGDGTVIFGELNDCSEWQTGGDAIMKPQRYQGAVVIRTPSLSLC